MEGMFQPTHLFFVLLIVLILFGPGKLSEIGNEIDPRNSVSWGPRFLPGVPENCRETNPSPVTLQLMKALERDTLSPRERAWTLAL